MSSPRPKERGNEIPSSPERLEKFKEQRKVPENNKKDKDEKALKIERRSKPDKEGKLIVTSEKGKVSEKTVPKDGKEDKENISENDREFSIDTQIEKKPENDNVKTSPENLKETKKRRGRPPVVPPIGQCFSSIVGDQIPYSSDFQLVCHRGLENLFIRYHLLIGPLTDVP